MKYLQFKFQVIFVFFLALTANAQSGSVMIKDAETKLWGYVDLEGNTLIKPQYKSANPFSKDGIAKIRIDRTHYFIDAQGAKLKTPVLKSSEKHFSSGLLAVQNEDKEWGYMNKKGEMAIDFQFERATRFDKELASVKKDGQWFVINKNGKLNSAPKDSKEIKKFSEGMAPYISESKKQGYVNGSGSVAISAKYKSVGYFTDGKAWIKNESGKVGYIDKNGTVLVKPTYDVAGDFDPISGLARVKARDTWMYVNAKGDVVKAPSNSDLFGHFHSGLAKGRVDELVGFYNNKGEWVIKPQFDGVKDFHDGFAAAKKNELWGVINTKGEWVVKPKYTGIKDPVVFN